jgi:nucleoside-diphosphate-sugar epimerase
MTYTIFVTGGSGFIGSAFVRCAVEAGHHVQVLTRSEKSAERVRASGTEAVIGDLNSPGPWQEAVSNAQVVVHLAQPETYGEKVTTGRAERFREQRLRMDANLLDCLRPETTQRVMYVAGTSYYGDQGVNFVDEDTTPNPKGWGPYIAPAIEALNDHIARGLPIITVFPAWVYGPGSWYAEYQLEPLMARKALPGLRGPDPTISVIHVEDVARAVLHLIEHGEVGQRYFVADDRPLPGAKLAELTAKELGVPLRIRRYPKILSRLVVGPIITESLTTEARLSNARLKKTGFALEFPNTEQGVPDVVARWRKRSNEQRVEKR